ncbi:uncharacterized protein PFB0765w-like [Camponotus floridanus]|uniref:uncharacterized protein PFB0765w-like n=1 Tax=Camponotus floridanus TaxID=104421 RepID=UPI000DC68E2E|nr:uncharacterized protein PFB0765w-like [Camponotus floridanus]
MTTNVQAVGGEMIDDSNEEDYIHKSIFIPPPFKIERIDDLFEEVVAPRAIFIPENFVTLSEKNIKEVKDVRKKSKQNKNEEEMEKQNKKKLKNIEVTQQQITTNVKAAGLEMIDDSNEEDYIHKSIFIPPPFKIERIDDLFEEVVAPRAIFIPENFVKLSEKNIKEVKDVRKKSKQNKNEEEIEKQNKKKLKNIEVTQQQITTNVKAAGLEMIDDSNEEDYIHKSIFIPPPFKIERIDDLFEEVVAPRAIFIPENFVKLSEKNIKEVEDVRKKSKQNKNEEEMEKQNKKKLKNIEVTQQQITTNVKAAGLEMIDDSNEEDYIHKSIFIPPPFKIERIDDLFEEVVAPRAIFIPENFVKLSEKNIKEVEDVRKKSKQNKNEEEMEKQNKKKLKNIEVTQQQITTNVKAAGLEMIDDSNEEDYIHKSIFIPPPFKIERIDDLFEEVVAPRAIFIPENFVKLSEKNIKEVKDVRKKSKQNKNEEEMEKQNKKKLKNIEVTQQQITTNVKAAGLEMIDDSNEEDYIHKSIFIPPPFKIERIDDLFEEVVAPRAIFIPENFVKLSEKNIKEVEDVRKKSKQNKNEEEMEKQNKKKLKNIEVTQQQITTNVKAAGLEMIDDSNEEDYIHKSIFIPPPFKIERIDDLFEEVVAPRAIFIPENFVKLSEKNIKEVKDVRKKSKQNKNEEEMEKQNKKKLKNIEVTQQQITTNVIAAGLEMIDDSNEEDYIHKSIFIPPPFKIERIDDLFEEVVAPRAIFIPENFVTLSEKNIKEVKDVRKKSKQNKNEEEMEKQNKKKLKNIEVTQQQITTNVKAAGLEMIDDSNEEDYIHKSIFIPPPFKIERINDLFEEVVAPRAIFIPENFVTLSEKNIKEVKDVRKKSKQNKNEEEMEKQNKKKLKNIEVTQQQITTNVKAAGLEMIDDSNEEDYIHKSIFIPPPFKIERIDDLFEEVVAPRAIFIPENFVTLSEKNIKEVEDVRKKSKQNKNEEEMEKQNKKKLKNIEVTQQQITTNVKAAGLEMIDDSNEEDYIHKSIFIPPPFEVEMIDDLFEEVVAPRAIFIPKPENFASLSEKNIKEVKDVLEKFEQSAEQVDKYSLTELVTDSEEKMNKMLNNETKAIKLLEDIETKDESIIIRKQIRGEDKVTNAKTENKRDDTIFIKKLIFLLSLRPNTTKDQKIIKNIMDNAYQPPDDYHSLEYAYKKFIDACTSQQRDKNQLGVSDANTHIRNRIKHTYCNLAEDILKLKYYEMNDHVNNICQTTVNNKSKEHGYILNETVEEDQVIKVVEEKKIKEVENTDPGTTSNETLLYGKDVILENNSKMTNETLIVEDISNVAHKIDKQIDVWKIWWTIYIENIFTTIILIPIIVIILIILQLWIKII